MYYNGVVGGGVPADWDDRYMYMAGMMNIAWIVHLVSGFSVGNRRVVKL